MQRKTAIFHNRGMSRDLSISKQNGETAYENFNIRITPNGHDTLLTCTNEKGNKKITLLQEDSDDPLSIQGTIIGNAVLNEWLILFTTQNSDPDAESTSDSIYRIRYSNTDVWRGKLLVTANLNFCTLNPIETLSLYETESLQKVYWVDGRNQPRVLNFMDENIGNAAVKNTYFDFITSFSASPSVSFSMTHSGVPQFPSGVMQIVLTYSNQYMQETNPVYVSDLIYLSTASKGSAPDSLIALILSLSISNIDTSFQYLNIYTVVRTSLNSTPQSYKAASLSINNNTSILYTLNSPGQESVDPYSLLYIGGQRIIAGTMTQKDNTLFLGDLTLVDYEDTSAVKEAAKALYDTASKQSKVISFEKSSGENNIDTAAVTGLYPYESQLKKSSSSIKSFKGGEKYRFGIRLISNTGYSTQAFFIGDAQNSIYPEVGDGVINRVLARITLPQSFLDSIRGKYSYIQPLMVEPSQTDRQIVAQGVLQPTLFNMSQRIGGTPYVVSSWFTRMLNHSNTPGHYYSLKGNTSCFGEVQCMSEDEVIAGMDKSVINADMPIMATHYIVVCNRYDSGMRMSILLFKKDEETGKFTVEGYGDTSTSNNAWNGRGDGYNGRGGLASRYVSAAQSLGYRDVIYAASSKDIALGFLDDIRDGGMSKQHWKCVYPNTSGNDKEYKWEKGDDTKKYWEEKVNNGDITPEDIQDGAGSNDALYAAHYGNYYFLDASILTFHSPDIDESFAMDNMNLKCRVIGYAELTGNISQYRVQATANSRNTQSAGQYNFSTINPVADGMSGLSAYPYWNDLFRNYSTNEPEEGEAWFYDGVMTNYVIYPWHKQGSINEEFKETVVDAETGQTEQDGSYSELENHVVANLWFLGRTHYLENKKMTELPADSMRLYNYEDSTAVSLNYRGDNVVYQGNVDFMLSMYDDPIDYDADNYKDENGDRKIEGWMDRTTGYNVYKKDKGAEDIAGTKSSPSFEPIYTGDQKENFIFYDPIRIQYKSSPHMVMSLQQNEEEVIKYLWGFGGTYSGDYELPWENRDADKTYDKYLTLLLLWRPLNSTSYTDYTGQLSTVTDSRQYVEENFEAYKQRAKSAKCICAGEVYYRFNELTIVKKDYPAPYNVSVSFTGINTYNENYNNSSANITDAKITVSYNVASQADRINSSWPVCPASVTQISGLDPHSHAGDSSGSRSYEFNIGTINAASTYSLNITLEGEDSSYNWPSTNYGSISISMPTIVNNYPNSVDVTNFTDFEANSSYDGQKARAQGRIDITEEDGIKRSTFTFTSSGEQYDINEGTPDVESGSTHWIEGYVISEQNPDPDNPEETITSYALVITALADGERYTKTQYSVSNSISAGTAGSTTATRQFSVSSSSKLSSDYRIEDYITGVIQKYSVSEGIVPMETSTVTFSEIAGNPGISSSSPYVYIAEIYDSSIADTAYGGTSDYAIENNVFIPAGDMVAIPQSGSMELLCTEGDTYIQRWDCLKTYPFSSDSINQVVDIMSVMLETHKNIAGRYDNFFTTTNIAAILSPDDLKYNDVYNQTNNFYTYNILSSNIQDYRYPNQITWSRTKTFNEVVDSWTNVTLASLLDLDGDKGPVRALRRYQNSIIAFQDRGIAEVLFNSRTQMATTQGVPVELMNSGKVDGKRYITDKAGCRNKWGMVETKSGIYFIDNMTSSISLFNGSLISLSDQKGFKNWIGNENNLNIWNPHDYGNFISFWDRINDDVYFIKNSAEHNTLCYNELLQQFTSFFNYGKVDFMANVQDKFIASRNNELYLQGEGDYNSIFGEVQPFYMEFKVTPDPYEDKIFTNLEYRADVFDKSNVFQADRTFSMLTVSNEYQRGTCSPAEMSGSNLHRDYQRKFRIWRVDMPRDSSGYGLNRIRNPWISLRLTKSYTGNEESNERMEFHNADVIYYTS